MTDLAILNMTPAHYDAAKEIVTEMIAHKMKAADCALTLVAAIDHVAVGTAIAARDDRKASVVEAILVMVAQLPGLEESKLAQLIIEASHRMHAAKDALVS